MKQCTRCREVKSRTEFDLDSEGYAKSKCKKCYREYAKERYEAAKNRYLESAPPSEARCFKCKRVKSSSEFNKNKYKKDGLSTYCKVCAAEKLRVFFNSDKERTKLYQRKYRSENMDKVNAYNTKQNIVRRKLSVPPWADLKAIRAFYTEAKRLTKETGTKHQVDHMVPLKHKLVCGLHVPWNLQVLLASENSKKSNKFEVL